MATRIENEVSFGERIAKAYRADKASPFKSGSLYYWNTPGGRIRRRRRVEMIKDLIAGSDKCLEIGCADGGWSQEFSPVVGHLYGIDISPDFLEIAKERGLTSTVSFPRGNLAPEGSVIKSTAIDPSVVDDDGVYRKTGPARVFVREKDAISNRMNCTFPGCP